MKFKEIFEEGKYYQKLFVERLHLKTLPFFEFIPDKDCYLCVSSFTIEAKIILTEKEWQTLS